MEYLIHSGGSGGADMVWENTGLEYGIKTVAYSFYNHAHESQFPKILSPDELSEGWGACKVATKTLKRPLNRIMYPYIKNLISRNWFQVKNSEATFAIGTFVNDQKKLVNGGTGWAVQMSIDNNHPVYFYDQKNENWNIYSEQYKKFLQLYELPAIPKNFAGIGTRQINQAGIEAIEDLFKHCFK